MSTRLFSSLFLIALAAAPVPAAAEFDSWGYDEDGYGESEYDPADAVTVRRQLDEVGRRLNTGLAALEVDDWTTAQYECAKADDAAQMTDYSGEAAFVEGRTIARRCIADAAYGRDNVQIACEWWAKVDYDSFIWEDPYAICTEQ